MDYVKFQLQVKGELFKDILFNYFGNSFEHS